AAPEIRARRRGRQEYQSALLVRRHRRPDVGVAGDDATVNQRVKAPARPPGPRVEGAHPPERRLDADIVRYRRADNDDAAAYHRRRRDLEFAGPSQRRFNLGPDLATGAKIGAGKAGSRI